MNLVVIFIGALTVTSYRSVPSQTDSTPFHTSTGEKVSVHGVAVSWDLLCGACRKLHKRCKRPDNPTKLHYGDLLYIEPVGFRVVNDIMGKRKNYKIRTKTGLKRVFKSQRQWVDVWVKEYKDERAFHKAHSIKQHKIWKVKEINEADNKR